MLTLIALTCLNLLASVPDPSPEPSIEVVATMTQTPGNVAVSPDGRLFASLHPYGHPKARVVEVFRDQREPRPYPNVLWSKGVGRDGIGIQAIIGIRCGPDGVLWMLDAGGQGVPPKLVAWDTNNEHLVRVIHLPNPATNDTSFVQDLALDLDRQRIYLADCGLGDLSTTPSPAIIVVNLKTGTSRRLLEKHASLMPEADAAMTIDGTEVRALDKDAKPFAPRVGLNPITIDPLSEFVYFGAMHGTRVYRIRAALLADEQLTDDQLAGAVEEHGRKGVSDGMSVDNAGNIYVTDVANNAIGLLEAAPQPDGTRRYRLLHQDAALLSWPDGISMGADGFAYVVVNQLHRHPALNAGKDSTMPPFHIVRFKTLEPSAVGR